ncbi:hypothetical protein BGZ75_007470 [Mortierella antarctica]|nr:hypothetical protein BGZ75_007470 [Mortierella antarctica]
MVLPSSTSNALSFDKANAKFTFHYFPFHGLGACARALLSFGDVQWDNRLQSMDEWPQIKDTTAFGTLPVLIETNTATGATFEIPDSGAIERYLAKKFGLLGDTPREQTLNDVFYAQAVMLNTKWAEKIVWGEEESRPKAIEQFLQTTVPNWAKACERHLKENGNTGHFVDNKLTLADIKTAVVMDTLMSMDDGHVLNTTVSPCLLKLKETVDTHASYAAWRKSEEFGQLDAITQKAFFAFTLANMHKMFRLHSKASSATSSTTSFSGGSSGTSGNSSNNSYISSNPGSKVGIYLVGATYLDTILHVDNFPAEDTKQRAERVEQRRGGNAANTAEVLGQDPRAKVWYMSSMPSPVASKVLLKALEESNVKTDACVYHSSQLSPPQAYIISASNPQTRTIISHSTLPDLTLEEFIKKFDVACMRAVSDIVQMSCPFRWIHFEGRGAETYKMIDHIESVYIRQGWRQKLTISVEFEKGDRPGIKNLLQQADVCFFSKLYAETLGFDRPEDFLASIGDYCKPTSSAGKIDMVMDSVGAGDTFIAGIILALGVRGYDIGRGLRFACELASLKCTQYGFKRLLRSTEM